MKAKVIFIEKKQKIYFFEKPNNQKPKPNVIFHLHQYPIYRLGTIFTIKSMQIC